MKKLLTFINLIIIILETPFLLAQESKITFEHFSVAQGMYKPIVRSVIRDRDGYLWFGTLGTIEKFDGYQFSDHKYILNNPNFTTYEWAEKLYEDRNGNIWVGTVYNGLQKFDKTKDLFTHYNLQTTGPKTEWSDHVFSICEDKYGILWVGTGDGLYKFDKKSNKFICVRNDDKNPESIGSNGVNMILEDKAGSLWFGNSNGLDKLDRETGKFIHVWYDPNNKSESPKYWVNTIFEDKSGIIWLGTREGMIAFDQKAGTFTPYIKEERNSISSICEDESGRLWIGSWESGLYSFDQKTKKLTNYLHDNKDFGSLSSNSVTSLCFEPSGSLWIATHEGLNKLNISKKAFEHYRFDEILSIIKGRDNKIWINTKNGLKKLDSQTGQIIQSPVSFNDSQLLYEDSKGNLWFAKVDGGLVKQDKLGRITKFYASTGQEFKYSVVLIYETSDRNIWIGTYANGFFSLDLTTQKINRIKIPDAFINCIYEDAYGLLWIGTFNKGLYSYNRKIDSIKSFIYDPNDNTSIGGQIILDAFEDKSGILWFGTNGGVNKYDRSTGKFTRLTNKDGLPRIFSFTILEDNSGKFWFNSHEGISKFDPKTNSIQNFNSSDGLPENGFWDRWGVKSDDGRIYFANTDELIGFHPDNIQNNNFIPPIVITNFLVFDKSFAIKNKIELSHTENFPSFEFAALNYVSTEKNQYAYKMEGVDKDWVYSGTRHFASYPNLDPGEYVFRVKGSNNDGVWNEEGTSIAIIISPPFWKTWWAYLSYIGIFIFALYGMRRYEMNRISLKNKIKVDGAILKEKEEMDGIKSKFFANISHEFRTPLTLILGPAEKIEKNESANPVKDAGIITRNSKRLLQLVNQLLDLSKLEAGKLKLEASKGNIVSFVKGVALSFESLAESKDITLKLQPEKDLIDLYFDKEKMMKILSNLLSNAFKFTPEEGKITVSVRECNAELAALGEPRFQRVSASSNKKEIPDQVRNDNWRSSVEIKIRDTGIGIAQEEIPKLFDRFYQVDSSQTRDYEGTGIGLALTKELVELHLGRISVESEKGSYTEFTLKFLTGSGHLKSEEIINEERLSEIKIPIDLQLDSTQTIKETDNKVLLPNDTAGIEVEKNIVLVVEDNYDMRQYIRESLDGNYLVEEAMNGEQGIRKAEKIIPDLIISDLMMPKMDGNELVRKLKNDEKTSHIPIILLTAKAGQENKLEGLETGADDYLTKPFDIKELQVRIKNLISIRKKLQEKFSKIGNQITEIKELRLSSIDEKFMLRVGEVIDKHISEEDFSIEEFGNEVGMSRAQFHRKFKAITGKPASMFLRSIRLVKAKKMIEEQQGNISEIAYSVGFASPSYFSKCFRDEFGFPPSDLVN